MIDADVYNEDANYDEQFWNVLGKSADGEHAELTSMTRRMILALHNSSLE